MFFDIDIHGDRQDASEDAKVMLSKADSYLCVAAPHLIFERSW